MKQFLFPLRKRKQKEIFTGTRKFTMAKAFIRLPVEWQLLFALLLLMSLRLATIVAFIVKQL